MISPALFIGLTAFFMVTVNADPPPLCPSVTPMDNLNVSRANGQWFVQLVGSNGVNQPAIKCEMRTLTAVNNGGYINIHVDYLRNDVIGEAFDTNFVLVPQSGNPAYMDVQDSPTNNTQIIIDTDYESYISFVDCFQLGDSVGYYVVVMTADRVISDALVASTVATLTANGLNDGLAQMNQTQCRRGA